jgi:hypothetical protein
VLYKTSQVQVTEEDAYERRSHFHNWFLQVVHGNALDPKRPFFIDEALFHLSQYINAQLNRY